jgi:hypothetical protein
MWLFQWVDQWNESLSKGFGGQVGLNNGDHKRQRANERGGSVSPILV